MFLNINDGHWSYSIAANIVSCSNENFISTGKLEILLLEIYLFHFINHIFHEGVLLIERIKAVVLSLDGVCLYYLTHQKTFLTA